MVVVAGIALFLLLPAPWNVVALASGIAIGFGETFVWWYALRRRQVQMGAETMIGERGRVVEACRPDGKVMLLGELWQARCEQGAGEGETVRVVDRERLLLVVEPERTRRQPRSAASR